MRLNELHSAPRGLHFVHQTLIEGPPATFLGQISPGLEFLFNGNTDLGFENLGLSNDEYARLALAFWRGSGVAIPGTNLKMRQLEAFQATIAPADGTEPTLPDYWKKAVLVARSDNKLTWVGHLVRDDSDDNPQYRRVSVAGYIDNGEALVPPPQG